MTMNLFMGRIHLLFCLSMPNASRPIVFFVTVLFAVPVLAQPIPPVPSPASSPASPAASVPKPKPDHHGINAITKRLGAANVPTGRGVTVGHVEGGAGSYLPDMSSPQFQKVRVIPRSGKSKKNGHASATARSAYGDRNIASGVRELIAYSSRGWLGEDYLNTGTARPPRLNNVRVFNHSWIGGGSAQSVQTQDVLRRIDYQVDTNNVMMVMGVNNGRDTPVPALLGSAYNGIAVGVSSGKSSGGYTRVETAGRCKPDIVAVRGQTSFSTPTVTAIMARLIEGSDSGAEPRRSGQSEVLKALLLAGAVKPGGWRPAPGRPLDERLGAGVARFDHAYEILTAGSVSPGRLGQRYGWDLRELPGGSAAVYRFDTALKLRDISIMLVWNRRVDGRVARDLITGRERWSNNPRLCNFDLQLVRVDANGSDRIIAESVSEIDNVEHIYFKALPSGRYELRVIRPSGGRDPFPSEAWEYALAFRMEHRKPVTPDGVAGAAPRSGGGGAGGGGGGGGGGGEAGGANPLDASGGRGFVPIRDKGSATFDLSGLIDPAAIDALEKQPPVEP